MRNLNELNEYRCLDRAVVAYYGTVGDETCGAFVLRSPIDNADIAVIASSGEGWDHVSVSRKNRTPNWREMEYVKRLFFKDDETAIQYHVPESDHINVHEHCLHLWRPQNVELPRPPSWMVGIKDAAE